MKKNFLMGAVFGALAFAAAGSAHASMATITDTYIGGIDSGTDAIGGSKYEVTSLNAVRSGNNLTVTVFTNYANNIGASSTQIGSLFIGDAAKLNLAGTGPGYTDDSFSADTDRYSYAFDYDIANSAVTGGASGTGSLFALNGDGSDVRRSFGNIKRKEQGVDITGGTKTNVTGTWSIGAGTVTFNIADFFAISGLPTALTLAWTMSCANDVILGVVELPADQSNDVPLPAGLLLLASGLGGMGFLGRRRKAAK